MPNERHPIEALLTRRGFLKSTAAASVAMLASSCATAPLAGTAAHPGGSDKIRVGLVGCGGRGTSAAGNCIDAAPGVELVAMGDMFQDKLDASLAKLRDKYGAAVKVTGDTAFTGWDAYQKVLACDIDMVILATPPFFRPQHLEAAVAAGKHIFMEKPVAVDPVGCRKVIELSDLAAKKGLSIVAGTQRRHDPAYIETIRRIHDGAIGELVGGQCYWNHEDLWVKLPQPEWSEMEWQIRNWLYFDWLSGDHIVEQHIHNIDVMNWCFGGPPERAIGMGGRQARVGPEFGNIYDHFAIEFVYPGGVRVASMCRQIKGAATRVGEAVVGTKGRAEPRGTIKGKTEWKYDTPENRISAQVIEHTDLIRAIREGKPVNEGRRMAESNLTAILGRMAAYSGREVSFEWVAKASKLDLTPARLEFGPNPVNPVPIPGQSPLI